MTTPFNPFGDISDDSTDEDISFGESIEKKQPTQESEKPKQQEPNFSKPEKKYNIVDQYWLINPKLFAKEKLEQGEIQLLTIGYNADFNNMRITLYDTSPDTFSETAIHKHNAKQLVTVNVFTETVEQLLFNISKPLSGTVYNFERIFSQSMVNQDWTPAKSLFEVDAQHGQIRLKVNDKFSYIFKDWQLKALINTFKFMTNGGAWSSSLKS